MYDNIFTYTDPNFGGHFQFTDAMPPSAYQSAALLPTSLLIPEQLAGAEFDWVKSEICNSSGASGCSSYYDGSPSSLASQCTQRTSLMQRSVSSHSFPTNGVHQPVLTAAEFLEKGTGTVRRVCSTGDLQKENMVQHHHRTESPLSNESTSSSIIESMKKACPYSAEEKKERIERYRSKRNQRNFTKKIKYACRKTLADSRPRIRGRFAKNEEIEQRSNFHMQWSHIEAKEDYEEEDNWVNFIDAFSTNLSP